jgi:hypothetical protein
MAAKINESVERIKGRIGAFPTLGMVTVGQPSVTQFRGEEKVHKRDHTDTPG